MHNSVTKYHTWSYACMHAHALRHACPLSGDAASGGTYHHARLTQTLLTTRVGFSTARPTDGTSHNAHTGCCLPWLSTVTAARARAHDTNSARPSAALTGAGGRVFQSLRAKGREQQKQGDDGLPAESSCMNSDCTRLQSLILSEHFGHGHVECARN